MTKAGIEDDMIRTLMLVLAALLLAHPTRVGAEQPRSVIEVYKSPTCGCCSKWVEHLRAHGFTVRATDTAAVDELKAKHGVPRALRSCHTAIVSGFWVGGHVPAPGGPRLLRVRAALAGVAGAGAR